MPKFKNKKSPETVMKRGFVFGILIFLSLMILPLLHAAQFNYVISNSEKWTDVYSGVMYANLLGLPSKFLVSTGDGSVVINEIDKTSNIQVLSSTTEPYVFNYPQQLTSAGFAGASEIKSSDMNLELINDLPNITNFIVVGDSFGYNALAVAPYAVQEHAWVFLANANNIYQIDSILSKRNINSLLIYGYVDPSVRNVLSKYNPEIIDNGNRFTDNIQIVNKYLKLNPIQQVILTNGEFIEKEIMSGAEPVLFTGQQNVPSQISDWLRSSNIKVGVLIGNNLIGAATNIRRTTGISVMVKFARSARDQLGGVAPVQGLDLFPVPTPSMDLVLHSVDYNTASSELEVTYQSDSNIPIYMKGTISVNDSGSTSRTGDLNPIFISPGEYKTIQYPMNLTPSQNMTAEVYTLYGETSDGLELVLDNITKVSTIQVIDSCKLTSKDVQSVNYNKQKQEIFIKVKNPNNVACWASGELQNLKIGYTTTTVGTQGAIKIPAGRARTLEISQKMSDSDIQNNPTVSGIIYSGEKQDSLVHQLPFTTQLGVQVLTTLTYSIIAIAIIIIALMILFIVLKKKQKDYY